MSDSIYGRARKHWAHARLESITLDSYLQAAVINGVQFPSGSYLSLNSAFDSGQTGYLHTDGSQITVLPATGGGDSELTGDVTKSVGSTVTTLQPVANSKLVEMPALTIKGNPSASMAAVEDLTVPQVKTLLNITASDIGGLSSFISSSPTNITLATGVTTAAQEPAHTGDVTNPTGSLVLTISPNAVTNEKSAQMPTLTMKGNNTGVTDSPLDLTASQVKALLAIAYTDISGLGALSIQNTVSLTTQVTGTLQAAQEPAHTGDVTNPAGSLELTISPNAVTNVKAAQMPALTMKGNNTGITDSPLDLTASQVKALLTIAAVDISGLGTLATLNSIDVGTQVTGTLNANQIGALTGDVTSTAGSYATTISPNAVTNSKSAQMVAGTIKSNITGVTANAVDNTLVTVKNSLLDTNTTVPGSLIYRGASAWSGINPGTTGQVLTMTNATTPSFATPAPTSLSSLTAANNGNVIDNGLFSQVWNWSGSTTQNVMTMNANALTTGTLLTLAPKQGAIGLDCKGRIVSNMGAINNPAAQFIVATIDDAMTVSLQNASATAKAQSGFTAASNIGTATSGFAWMGINNSTFNDPQLHKAGVAGDVTFVGTGQDMIIANASQTRSIKFQTGKAVTPFFDDRMTILNNGNIGIGTITPLSTLDVVGSFGKQVVSSSSAAITVASTDSTIILTANINQVVTLPNVALFTRRIITLVNTGIIAKTTSIAYIPLYAAAGTTTAIAVGSYITLQSNGVSWNCISSNFRPTPAFKAYQTVAVSIPTSVATNLAMNTEYYDVLNNLTAGTFTAPYAGLYTFSAGVTMNTSDMAGDNIIQIVNITGAVSHTSGLAESGSTGTSLYRGNITCDMLLASGDQVVLRVLQQSGVAVNTFPGASNLWFSGRGCTP